MTSHSIDTFPEYINWKDIGCELCPSCLNCTLPRCIEEEPRGKQKLRMKMRSRQIADMHRSGKPLEDIARTFNISVRTVQRVLSAQQNGNGREKDNAV